MFVFKWYTLIFLFLGAVAYFNGVLLEGIVLFLSFQAIRYAFPTTYHNKESFYMCMAITFVSIWLCAPKVLPFSYSLFSCLFTATLVAWYAWYYQDKKDKMLFNMSEEQLRRYAASKGVSELMCDTLVLKLIKNYRWCEIQAERTYTKDGIRYHRETLEKKLKIKFKSEK